MPLLKHMFIIVLLIGVFAAPATYAQNSYSFLLDELSELNRIDPLQNPEFDTDEDIVARRILDRTNKTVGEVQNVILNPSGSISALNIEFDRLRLPAPLALNYRDMIDRPSGDGYVLNIEDNKIEDRFAELLASMQTASGNDDSTLTLSDLIGAPIKNQETKKTLGRIEHILFANDGETASAIYIKMTSGLLRGSYVAVPFTFPKWTQETNKTQKTAMLSDTQSKAVIEIAKDQ